MPISFMTSSRRRRPAAIRRLPCPSRISPDHSIPELTPGRWRPPYSRSGCRRLSGGLDRAEARKGYPALVTAAFIEAVERRVGTSYQAADIVTLVADVRARSERLAGELDPDVA